MTEKTDSVTFITCDNCGASVKFMNYDIMVRFDLFNEGWRFGDESDCCPQCEEKEPKR